MPDSDRRLEHIKCEQLNRLEMRGESAYRRALSRRGWQAAQIWVRVLDRLRDVRGSDADEVMGSH